MRVLYSITNLLVGGAQTFLVALANEMSTTGKVYIYCLHEPDIDREIASRISPRVKILIYPIIFKKNNPRLQKIFSILKIKRNAMFTLKKFHLEFLIKWLRIKVIHSQLYHSDHYITYIFRDHKIPVFITEHGCYNYVIPEGFATRDSIVRIFKRIDGAAYISPQNKEHIIDLTGNNRVIFRKMNNGIPKVHPDPGSTRELKESLEIKKNDFVFGMVARGIEEKGWEIAAAAFKELQKQTNRGVHLIFIGDSSYLRELKTRLEKQSNHHIHFLGGISGPVKWVRCFDVGLLPSYFAGESVPMTVIEYLACDKPVIATNAGSIKEMITNDGERAGIIFDYHRDFKINVKNLQEAMGQYLQNPELLKKHGATANQCFKKFDIKNITREYKDFYRSLIETKSGRLK